MLNKNYKDVKDQWDLTSEDDNWRGFLAAGHENEESFRTSGAEWTQRLLIFLLKHNIYLSNSRIVELGCGAGRMTEFLALTAKRVQAVDISAGMITRARERLGKLSNAEFLCIIRDFSIITDLSIDIIFSVAVLQHNPEDTVRRLFQDGIRILKKGGYFVFQIPIDKTHHEEPYEPQHSVDMVYWTIDELQEIARVYKYKIINIPKDTMSNGNDYFIFQKI